ncbi:hypothetical protein PAMP_020771 [Pampus punctatissimus]
MKIPLMLSVILYVALSIKAATVAPAEAAAEPQQDDPAPNSDMDAAAGLHNARFGFCLDGWLSLGDSCYYLNNNVDTWTNAERYCADFDSSLASVHSIWEYNFLQRMVKTGGHTFAWIGGYHFQGDWRWEDGSQFNYLNWEPGTESSTDFYQCLQLNSQESKGWSNHGCSMRFPFVCQRRSNC